MRQRQSALQAFLGVVILVTSGCGAPQEAALDAELQRMQARDPIVHGSTVPLPHFEATGALVIATQKNAAPIVTQLCTATLVAPDYAVTAAHCKVAGASMGTWQSGVPNRHEQDPAHQTAEPQDAGLRGTRRRNDSMLVWYTFCLRDAVAPSLVLHQDQMDACTEVEAFVVHPNFRLPGPWDEGLVDACDVGVVRLSHAITSVEPATLATAQDSAYLKRGQIVSIAGFGSTHDRAAVGFVAQASGIKRYARTVVGSVSTFEMTIGEPPWPAHKSFGDSGGPTFIETPSGARLIGITSRLLTDTDAAMGTIDTRLDTLGTWIRQTAAILKGSNELSL